MILSKNALNDLNFRKDLITEYVYKEKCTSTNTLALELIRENKIHTNTAIVTSKQTDGRGQRGSKWEGKPFKNIHLTIVLKLPNTKIENVFNINMLTSFTCHSVLFHYLHSSLEDKNRFLKIKWPNDIYWKNQKLGGILIENIIYGDKISYSIIGIGINVNQQNFNYDFNKERQYKATSLSLINKREAILENLISDLINTFSYKYLSKIIDPKTFFEKIKKRYISILYRFDGNKYSFKNHKETFVGTLHDVDYYGRLHIIREDGAIESYLNKEIQFL